MTKFVLLSINIVKEEVKESRWGNSPKSGQRLTGLTWDSGGAVSKTPLERIGTSWSGEPAVIGHSGCRADRVKLVSNAAHKAGKRSDAASCSTNEVQASCLFVRNSCNEGPLRHSRAGSTWKMVPPVVVWD